MKNKTYLPKVRDILAPSENDLVSKAPNGSDTYLANHVTDPITVNNIACQEFDYTED